MYVLFVITIANPHQTVKSKLNGYATLDCLVGIRFMAAKRALSSPPPVSGLPDCVFSLQPASARLLSVPVASPG